MSGRRRFLPACRLFVLLVLWGGLIPLSPRAQPVDTIAVLSPGEGPLEEVGQRHDESVRKAFGLTNGTLTMRVQDHDHILRVLFHSTGTGTDSTACVQRARNAVDDGALAILGPVSSDCAGRLLDEELEVPIISSLATARDLRGRSKWFFRTINDDKERLQTFVGIARDRGIGIDSSIAIYRSSDYGRGLHSHLIADDSEVGLDSTHTFRWEDVIVEGPHEAIDLVPPFRGWVSGHDHAIKNVFVLGSDRRRADVVAALDEMFQDVGEAPNFVLVGSEAADALPAGTWVIGESRVGTSQNIISELERRELSQELFIPTLDAGIALKRAIRNALHDRSGDSLSRSRVRSSLREELANGRFPSSERGRSVEFQEGHIRSAPTTPVHRVEVERHLQRVNPVGRESWVEVNVVKEPIGHLEGPVVVELIPHGPELVDQRVDLQVTGLGPSPIQVEEVTLNRHGKRVSFSPSFFRASTFPSSFSVGTSGTPIAERKTVGPFGWPWSYPLAALAAVIGALLYARYSRQRDGEEAEGDGEEAEPPAPWTWRTYAERCLAGLAIAFLIIHVGPLLDSGLLSQIPIPQFGSSWWINASLSGLLGGWLGLSPIVSLVASVIGAVTPLFES